MAVRCHKARERKGKTMKGDIKVKSSEVSLATRLMLNAISEGFNQINSRGKHWGGYNCIGNASDACGKVARLFGVQNWTIADFRLLDARSMGVSKGKFTSRSAMWFANEFANWTARRAMEFQAGKAYNLTTRNIPTGDSFHTDSFAHSSIGEAVYNTAPAADELAPVPSRVRDYGRV